MRLYNSAWIDVFAGLVLKGAGLRRIRLTVRYGIIDLRERGLGLVDTGMGADVTRGPRSAALRLYSAVLRPQLIESQSPEAVLRNLGVTPVDIRLVVLTHFHADHVSSLRAFPNAQIITSAAAARNVMQMSAAAALHHGIFKELIPPDIERRLLPLEDLKRVPTGTVLGDGHDLFGDGSYLAVPLPGHAFGHFGIFWRDDARPGALCHRCHLDHRSADAGPDAFSVQRHRLRRPPRGKANREHTKGVRAARRPKFHLCHDTEEPAS